MTTLAIDAQVIQWGYKYLLSHGYALTSNQIEEVNNTPWSYVGRFATCDGYIYLKHTPELLALEAPIIQILRDQFHAPVAKIIAHNDELNCFLMKDAGTSLREILKQKFDEALLYKAIDQFASLQLTVADHVNVFLDIGVPDWRLDKFPDLYRQLLSQKDILIADGLSETEISNLEALTPKVASLCKNLSGFSIKQTIVQPDFNDNNTLINNILQEITIIDLGEISISHPFFSLINLLYAMKKHHALTDEDDLYQRIKDACLKNYMAFESKNNILDAFEIACMLFHIYGALCSHRLMIACNKAKFTPEFQGHGRPSIPLKGFINASIVSG